MAEFVCLDSARNGCLKTRFKRIQPYHLAGAMKAVFFLIVFFFSLLVPVFRAQADDDASGDANIGERLFLETRFAQFFFTNSGGNANFTLTNGDPVNPIRDPLFGSQQPDRRELSATQEVLANSGYGSATPANSTRRSRFRAPGGE